jgi:hypothetical protein
LRGPLQRTVVRARFVSRDNAEDLYEVARGLARAGSDDDAIKAYRDVAVRFPGSFVSERALFHAARLELLGGHYLAAESSYAKYLAKGSVVGERRMEAEYEHAPAQLSSGHAGDARRVLARLAERAPTDRASRLRELEAVAAARSGDEASATAIFKDLALNEPLTFAGLAAGASLRDLGEPPPSLLGAADPAPPPGAVSAPLDVRLPAVPSLLVSIGLDADAEDALAGIERGMRARYPGRESEALCRLYDCSRKRSAAIELVLVPFPPERSPACPRPKTAGPGSVYIPSRTRPLSRRLSTSIGFRGALSMR